MRLLESDIELIRARLPALDFSQRANEYVMDVNVQKYLNHYSINFSQTTPKVSHQFGRFSAPEHEIAAHIWRVDDAEVRGTVFLLHGYGDNVGLMAKAIGFFLQQKQNVVAFDLPGHGLSSGERGKIDSFETYRKIFKQCLGRARGHLTESWTLVGQSTGTAVLMRYLLDTPNPLGSRAIMLAPLVRIQYWIWLRLVYPFLKLTTVKIQRRIQRTSHDDEFIDFLRHKDLFQIKEIPMVWMDAMRESMQHVERANSVDYPVHIIIGSGDRIVDNAHNVSVLQRVFPTNTLVDVKGAKHQLLNERSPWSDKVYSAITSVLESEE